MRKILIPLAVLGGVAVIAMPVAAQMGAPQPKASSNNAPASSGIMIKVIRGMAIKLANTP